MQLSKEMKHELYEEAQTNGLNEAEYKHLLKAIDNIINVAVQMSAENTKGIKPEDYDE